MATPTLHIHPRLEEAADTVRYEFDLVYSDGAPSRTIFYEFEREAAPAPPDNFDGILCAVVLHAMQEQHTIRLHGPATDTMLRNLAEFQLAWMRWRPAHYRPVAIEADEIVAPRVRPVRSLAAFSGGVDSSFTLLRNDPNAASAGYAVDTVVMVHGFDVALARTDALRELVDRTAPIRDLTRAQLRIVRTNSRELSLQRWEDSCGAQLAACLHLFSADFSHALIGSSDPYDELWLPWGTNPVTDHLLSGGQLAVVHDGAAYSRTDKLAFLAAVPAVLATLKVCWEGEQQGRNCGVCQKCVRTQLNLLAVGVVDAPCFDRSIDPREIRSLPIESDLVLAELESIVRYGERHHIEAPWFDALRRRVRKGRKQGTSRWTLKAHMRRSRAIRAHLVAAARRVGSKLAILASG